MDSIILSKLENIEKMLSEQGLLKKDVLNFNETADYLDISHSHLYKLTSTGSVPHYKPNGKRVYFKRAELDQWLLSNRQDSSGEIEQQAADYILKKGRVQL
jgi:excisionase family DNA binding protein